MQAKSVCVMGAGGRTGQLLSAELLGSCCNVKGVSRSQEGAARAVLAGIKPDQSLALDVTAQGAAERLASGPFQGCDAVVVAAASRAQLRVGATLIGALAKSVQGRAGEITPVFWFADGQSPRDVDWIGARVTIDAARAAGVRRVVLISSMGGCDPDAFMNRTMDRVLDWKRRAEVYLMRSGVPEWTIIHAARQVK